MSLIHNLKFGTLDRYGLVGRRLDGREAGPNLLQYRRIRCGGPLRDRPGYDPMMQAYGGLMSLLGEDGGRRSGWRLDHRHGDRGCGR